MKKTFFLIAIFFSICNLLFADSTTQVIRGSSVTYLFSDNWNTAVDAGDNWTSEIDDAEWTVVSNAAQFEGSTTTDTGIMTYDLGSGYDELYQEVKIKFAETDLGTSGANYHEAMRITDSSNASIIRVVPWTITTDLNEIARIRIYYRDDITEQDVFRSIDTMVDDTYITIKMYYKRDTTGDSQGIATVWVDDVEVYSNTAVDNNGAVNQMQIVKLGPLASVSELSSWTITYDDFWVSESDN